MLLAHGRRPLNDDAAMFQTLRGVRFQHIPVTRGCEARSSECGGHDSGEDNFTKQNSFPFMATSGGRHASQSSGRFCQRRDAERIDPIYSMMSDGEGRSYDRRAHIHVCNP